MANNKNILIVTQELPPHGGGAGVVAFQNAVGLTEAGHRVTLVAVSDGSPCPLNVELTLITVPRVKKLWTYMLARKLRQLPLAEYDTIILNDVGAVLTFALFFTRFSYIEKALIYLHGGEVDSVFERPCRLFKWVGFRGKYVELLRRSRQVVAVSEYMKRYFVERCPDVIDAQKIAVVYAGIDEQLFFRQEVDLRAALGIPPERTLLLSVSRIVKVKGFDVMVDVFEQMVNRDPHFHWIIVGDGPYLPELKYQINAKKLQDHVTFSGSLERRQLSRYYSGADLYWLLSAREGFGLVYGEAQACGLPVLGLRRSGVIEAVDDGVSGYLVDDDNECVPIISARDYLSLDKKAIVSFAEKFSLSRQVEKLEQVL
ncbi:MAG: glycosyltransferase family 4 protein [Desulfuromonadales bacterium]|nr:glycosyltransferase family 4 protein [Desulfuromonadales bacterium]